MIEAAESSLLELEMSSESQWLKVFGIVKIIPSQTGCARAINFALDTTFVLYILSYILCFSTRQFCHVSDVPIGA